MVMKVRIIVAFCVGMRTLSEGNALYLDCDDIYMSVYICKNVMSYTAKISVFY